MIPPQSRKGSAKNPKDENSDWIFGILREFLFGLRGVIAHPPTPLLRRGLRDSA